MIYLDKIKSPADLKKLNISELPILANEIRSFLLENVSKTGGHLASNLGVVELTLALHYCFNCPVDKIVWDVGHQAYTHKILTGRKDNFSTLRKLDGLSGFPKTEESKYDSFNTGHSSTSISAAIGLATARDLNGDNYNVVAVIGDGSLTGGLVYEALNNAGRNNTKVIIIVNDNEMSISQNVGNISHYLSEIRTTQKYNEVKNDIQGFFDNMPVMGKKFNGALKRVKSSIKYAVVPNIMFEEFGLKYFGPFDGHDINKLITVFEQVKKINKPIMLHIRTKKGKGYKYAEENPSKFHGVAKFDLKTGQAETSKKIETYSEVFGKTMVQLANKNKKLVAISAAMIPGTKLDFFAKTYPDRMFDVGIAEEHAVTFAAGMAINGFTPVFAVYSTFMQRCYDQILHDVCLQNLHVIFAVDRAGIVGSDGETHQGIYDLSFMSHIPNLTVMSPKSGNELRKMLDFAINECKGPVAIRYPRGIAQNLFDEINSPIKLGKSQIIYEGKHIALISDGNMMFTMKKVYDNLKERGYDPTLINARFISPVDDEMLEKLKKNHKYIFTAEDNIVSGGMGSKILQKAVEKGISNMIFHNFAFPDTFVEQGTRNELFERYNLDSKEITKKIISILGDKR